MLIFKGVRINSQKCVFLPILLELMLELVRTFLELIAYAVQPITEKQMRCTAMKNKTINWDDVPEIMTLEDMQQICHISKSTARYLLLSGKVPCFNSGKKTRCYKILKKDVMAYIADREEFPEYYLASRGWYSKGSRPTNATMTTTIPEIREDMHEYYKYHLRKYPDVLNTIMISQITGYGKTAINNWCKNGKLRHFKINGQNMVPKVYLIDFFCSPAFRSISRKSEWHMKILMSYPNWKCARNNN